MRSFEYLEPGNLSDALNAIGRYGEDARVMAGGTALVNLMKQQLVQPAYLIGLGKIQELGGISRNGELRIGALATHRMIETSRVVYEHAPLLTETLRHVATIRIRNVATIGGSLAHADPNQDPPPALIVLGARVKLISIEGEREMLLEDFFTGYYETALRPDELVTEIMIPIQPSESHTSYIKFLPRTQDDYATVSAAVRVTMHGGRIADARVAIGSAGPVPIRARKVEEALRGQRPEDALIRDAAELATSSVDPVSDFRGSAGYKRAMSAVFVRRALEQALSGTRGG